DRLDRVEAVAHAHEAEALVPLMLAAVPLDQVRAVVVRPARDVEVLPSALRADREVILADMPDLEELLIGPFLGCMLHDLRAAMPRVVLDRGALPAVLEVNAIVRVPRGNEGHELPRFVGFIGQASLASVRAHFARTTSPPFITNTTFDITLMSFSGSPSTATMSA